jgi:REP element-mobilizing transposase RayT
MAMFPRHRGRLHAFDYRGFTRYSLCFCTFKRSERFVTADAVNLALEQLLRAAREQAFAILAYCFMPDRVHLLVEGERETSDCRAFISRAKQYSGYCFNRHYGVPLWQRYGDERVLRIEERALTVARYIVASPVRAGLVARVEDYPFFGSSRYSIEELVSSAIPNL